MTSWAREEMATADLGDKRLNRRLMSILSALGEHPTASIPAACGGFNEMTAAYRFFDNDKVAFEPVLEPHQQRTRERIAAQETVLLVQDTTELDLTRPNQTMEGTGPLDAPSRRGALLHPLIAFTPDGTPLGTAWATMWTRAESGDETRGEKQKRRRYTPIQEKESQRWLDGLRQVRAIAQELPSVHCVCIADSEADIYELFNEPRGAHPVHWIVRAGQDRAVHPEADQDPNVCDMRSAVEASPLLFRKTITVRGRDAKFSLAKGRRQPRKGRTAEVSVRATTIMLRPPWRPNGSKLPSVTVNVVQVREENPPADDVPVEWLLVTTLPIDTEEQIRQIIQYYTVRFLIEVFFRVLKSGCRVEKRRFEHIERMMPCASTYLIVAWRTLMVCRLGRGNPELSCEVIFDPAEWQSVWTVVERRPLPRKPPPLAHIVRLVAQLGGYVAKPNRTDPPGPQTVWLGLQRMYDLAMGWKSFGPGATITPS
jgi:hypothetical protein